jgi:hypothetical protein
MKILNNNTVVLCCGGNKKCPVVEQQPNGMVKITDDYGHSIMVKKEELELVPNALAHFSSKSTLEEAANTEQLILG